MTEQPAHFDHRIGKPIADSTRGAWDGITWERATISASQLLAGMVLRPDDTVHAVWHTPMPGTTAQPWRVHARTMGKVTRQFGARERVDVLLPNVSLYAARRIANVDRSGMTLYSNATLHAAWTTFCDYADPIDLHNGSRIFGEMVRRQRATNAFAGYRSVVDEARQTIALDR